MEDPKLGPLIAALKPIREAAGITQTALGHKLGWADNSHVSNIERGLKSTDLETVERWIEACDAEIYVVPRESIPDGTVAAGVLGCLRADDRTLLLRLARALVRIDDEVIRARLKHDVRFLEDIVKRAGNAEVDG